MITITYKVYSKILDKTFTNIKEVKTMNDFEIFAMSLNLDYEIMEVK